MSKLENLVKTMRIKNSKTHESRQTKIADHLKRFFYQMKKKIVKVMREKRKKVKCQN